MGTVEFLSTLLPEEGLKVIAEGGVNPATGQFGFRRHYPCQTVAEAAEICAEIDARKNHAFYAVATFDKPQIWNERTQKWSVRLQSNAVAIKSLFLDVDVDEVNPAKYASKREAIAALLKFVADTGLPEPSVVDSGGGIHVYWIFTQAITVRMWQPLAEVLKLLANRHGFKADKSPTADCSRVLRPIGTQNHKRDVPRPVRWLLQSPPVDPRAMRTILTLSLPAAPDFPPPPTGQVGSVLGSNLEPAHDSEPLHFPTIVQRCAQMANLFENRGNVEEPLWYAGLAVARLCDKSEKAVAAVSDGHPRYSTAETAKKVQQLEFGGYGPTLCTRFDGLNPGLCGTCLYWGKIKSPAAVGRKTFSAPAPVVEVESEETGEAEVIEIPNPPAPYVRRQSGGIVYEHEDPDGTPRRIVIFDHDIFPIRREYLEASSEEVVVWRVNLPQDGWQDIKVPASSLYDASWGLKEMAAKGVYPSLENKEFFKRFLVSYVQELQRHSEVERVFAKLGWRDLDFVLPGKLITPGGVQEVRVSADSNKALPGLGPKGSFNKWKEAASFYNKRGYEPHMMTFLTAFGAPLLTAVGLKGAVINLVSRSGHGKTTILKAMNSVWGDPDDLLLNGTPEGSTYNARVTRISMYNNLPISFDEISNIDPEDASALCYMVAQGQGKLRLTRQGKDQGNIEQWRTIMACTSNSSLYSKLSAFKADASAEQARVFEIQLPPATIHTKMQADEFIKTIGENCGHAGEAFMKAVVADRVNAFALCEKILKRLDAATGGDKLARFWTATAAVNLAGGAIAIAAGVLPWEPVDLHRLEKWLIIQINQISMMVSSGVVSPGAVVAEYLDDRIPNTLVVGPPSASGAPNGVPLYPVAVHPKASLQVRVEPSQGRTWISKRDFRDYCVKRQIDPNETIRLLLAEKVILMHSTKKVLGRGTQYSGAQVVAVLLDSTHESLMGVGTQQMP